MHLGDRVSRVKMYLFGMPRSIHFMFFLLSAAAVVVRGQWECHLYSDEEYFVIIIIGEKLVCERNGGVFTSEINSNPPGCEDCHCCQQKDVKTNPAFGLESLSIGADVVCAACKEFTDIAQRNSCNAKICL